MPRGAGRAGAGPWACTAFGLRTRVRSSSASSGRGPLWSASVVWPCSSSTTIGGARASAAPARSPAGRGRSRARSGRAVLGLLGHRLREQPLEGDGHVGPAGGRHRARPGCGASGRRRSCRRRADLERRAAHEEVPQRGGEGVDVGCGRRRWSGRSSTSGGDHGTETPTSSSSSSASARPRPGDAEVGEARLAVLADQHVGRLDVAVDDAGPVGGLDRAGELDAGAQHLLDREALALATAPRGWAAGSTS